jgi:serine/threonine-protein kinase
MRNRWIWPFELEEKIGEGGMGAVYRARYVKDDRRVAVKLIPENLCSNPTTIARFSRELELLKTLQHPNIVRCFGGVCGDKQNFYAMELVEGGSLSQLLEKRGRLHWKEVVEYAQQMCAALAHAHKLKIIHRDVKPSNFLLTRQGQIQLCDFGVALVANESKLTTDGKTVGSVAYMAPEQITGKPVSGQTDLYSLGCVMFKMLTGEAPYGGKTLVETMQRHVTSDVPRIASSIPDSPALLDKLVAELLEKDPANRPPSAQAVSQRLVEIIDFPVAGNRRPQKAATAAKTWWADFSVNSQRLRRTLWTVLPMGLMLVIIAWLLLSNRSLMRHQRFVQRSEKLWIEAFHSVEPADRLEAARKLGELGLVGTRAVPTLIEGLSEDDEELRAACATALKQTGYAGKPAISKLIGLQNKDPSDHVRVQAAEALESIRAAEPESRWPTDLLIVGLAAALLLWFALKQPGVSPETKSRPISTEKL